jgi:hypothetical protein
MTTNMHRSLVSIVIPAFNEEGAVGEVVVRLHQSHVQGEDAA